jgi:hypothetical protein
MIAYFSTDRTKGMLDFNTSVNLLFQAGAQHLADGWDQKIGEHTVTRITTVPWLIEWVLKAHFKMDFIFPKTVSKPKSP